MQRLEKILAKTAARRVPQQPSYGNFGKVTQNPHFLKKHKGGTKGNFSKIALRVALVWMAPKHSSTNGIILQLVSTYKANTGKDFGENSGFKSARTARLRQFSQCHQKPAFSEKVQRGDQGKIFKNRPKSIPRLKGLKELWCKWHYLQTSMHLKCKDWRRS